MNEIETILDTVTDWLQHLYGAPAVALVLLSCIVIGYVLRCIEGFPNKGIPVVVILWAPLVTVLIADANNDLTLRVWILRNILVGLVVGFVAWILHKKVLSRLEDKLGLFQETKPQPPQTPT